MKIIYVIIYIFLTRIVSEGKHAFSFLDSNANSASHGVVNIRCVSAHRETDVAVSSEDMYELYNASFNRPVDVLLPYTAIPSGTGLKDSTVVAETVEEDAPELHIYAITYGVNSESFMALPGDAMGTLYYVLSYKQTIGNPVFVVTALESYGEISIYFNEDFAYNGETYNEDNPLTVPLNAKSFHVQTSFDPTGTRVESTGKIHVVSGNDCAGIGSSGCDHISESLPPVAGWGRNYALAHFEGRSSGYIVRVLASEDNTQVSFGQGDVTRTVAIDRGEMTEMDVYMPIVLTVSSTKPVLVAQFMRSASGSGSAPSITIVPSIEHAISRRRLPFTSVEDTSSHVTVWTSTADVGGLRIDDSAEYSWTVVGPAFGGIIVQSQVSQGPHYLSHVDPSVRLCGVAYGHGTDSSYAHPIYYHPMTVQNQPGEPPSISNCPAVVTKECPSDSMSTDVTWVLPTATSTAPRLPDYSSHQPGDLFDIGATGVTYQFSDTFGNMAECSFDVVVRDVTPPVVYGCPTSYNLTMCDGSPAVNRFVQPHATDNSNEKIIPIQQRQPRDNGPGSMVTFAFSDSSGNKVDCAFEISVTHPSNCRLGPDADALKMAVIFLGVIAFALFMVVACIMIWDYFKQLRELATIKRGSKSQSNDYRLRENPGATNAPDRGSDGPEYAPTHGRDGPGQPASGMLPPDSGDFYIAPDVNNPPEASGPSASPNQADGSRDSFYLAPNETPITTQA